MVPLPFNDDAYKTLGHLSDDRRVTFFGAQDSRKCKSICPHQRHSDVPVSLRVRGMECNRLGSFRRWCAPKKVTRRFPESGFLTGVPKDSGMVPLPFNDDAYKTLGHLSDDRRVTFFGAQDSRKCKSICPHQRHSDVPVSLRVRGMECNRFGSFRRWCVWNRPH